MEFSQSSSKGAGKATPPSKIKVKSQLNETDSEYQKRRNRNNIAVKKSRFKSKVKGNSTLDTINRLKVENVELESKVEGLSQELSTLKKVFMEHARGFGGGDAQLPDLQQLEQQLGYKLTEKSPAQRAVQASLNTDPDDSST
ncbi:CCAAT/enhancer-binding protein gamma-like [Clavelina lepadiformis]|uniref:BZIP domain-containing protein n=1 Tax=Clavelina lepadiformis TaxID=159417 RepID=A0ABP0GXF2_CLALP